LSAHRVTISSLLAFFSRKVNFCVDWKAALTLGLQKFKVISWFAHWFWRGTKK
jgi:hypothetical protein